MIHETVGNIYEVIVNSLIEPFLIRISSTFFYGNILIQDLIIISVFCHKFYNNIKIFLISVLDLMHLYSRLFHNIFSSPRWIFQYIIYFVDSIFAQCFCTIVARFQGHKKNLFIFCSFEISSLLQYIHLGMESMISLTYHFIFSFNLNTVIHNQKSSDRIVSFTIGIYRKMQCFL